MRRQINLNVKFTNQHCNSLSARNSYRTIVFPINKKYRKTR